MALPEEQRQLIFKIHLFLLMYQSWNPFLSSSSLALNVKSFLTTFPPAVPNDPLVPTAVLGETSGMADYVTFPLVPLIDHPSSSCQILFVWSPISFFSTHLIVEPKFVSKVPVQMSDMVKSWPLSSTVYVGGQFGLMEVSVPQCCFLSASSKY